MTGVFDEYGGQFVPETLVELRAALDRGRR